MWVAKLAETFERKPLRHVIKVTSIQSNYLCESKKSQGITFTLISFCKITVLETKIMLYILS